MSDNDEYGLSAEQKQEWRDYHDMCILADALVTVLAQLMEARFHIEHGASDTDLRITATEIDWRKAAEAWLRESK